MQKKFIRNFRWTINPGLELNHIYVYVQVK